MSKHTPGPWAYCWTYGRVLVFQKGESTIAAVPYDGDSEIPQAEANARLISAAPELLEALKFLMTAHGEQLDLAFEQAQSAIAKAEGWP